MSDLAKRAVACKGWRWLPGMRVGTNIEGSVILPDGFEKLKHAAILAHCVPILTDPATTGCLMQMLRDKYPTAEIEISWLPANDTTTIRIDDGHQWLAGKGATLAKALVAALEVERCPV